MAKSKNLERFMEACAPELSTGAKKLLLLCFEYFQKEGFPLVVKIPLSEIIEKTMINSLREKDYEENLMFSIRDIFSVINGPLLFKCSFDSFDVRGAILRIKVDRETRFLYMDFSDEFVEFVKNG